MENMHTVDAVVRTMPLSLSQFRFPGTKTQACNAAADAFRSKWNLAPNVHVDTYIVTNVLMSSKVTA